MGTHDQAPTPSFYFNFFYLDFLFLGRGVVGSNLHNPFYFNSIFHGFFKLTMRLWDQRPTTSLYFFKFLSLSPPSAKMWWVWLPLLVLFLLIYNFPLTLLLGREAVGSNATPLIYFFQFWCSKVLGSISTDLTCFNYIFKLLNLMYSRRKFHHQVLEILLNFLGSIYKHSYFCFEVLSRFTHSLV